MRRGVSAAKQLRFGGKVWLLMKESFREWSADNAARLGAALSYYTVFALAPLLLIITAVAGLFLGEEAVRGKLDNQLAGLVGADAAGVIQSAVAKASEQKSGIIATVVGLVTLLVGATGVMLELQAALNTVWKVIPKPNRGIKGMLRDRFLSLGLVLSFGFLLIVSLTVSSVLHAVGQWLSSFVPEWVILGYVLNYGVSIGAIALLFALMFKLLPEAKVAWRDVWVGAVVTSLLFHVGKYVISMYIGKASVGSAFGAAGSLAALLVWIYYSSQIVLLGAEFTRAFANHFGSHVVPTKDAVPAPTEEMARLATERALKEQGAIPPGAASAPGRA